MDALAKMTAQRGSVGSWIQHLPAAIWADRITVGRSTGRTSYFLAFGQEFLLLVDLVEDTWALIDWRAVEASDNPRAGLLALRARQLERRKEDLRSAAEMLKKNRESNKAYFDAHRPRGPEQPHMEIEDGD